MTHFVGILNQWNKIKESQNESDVVFTYLLVWSYATMLSVASSMRMINGIEFHSWIERICFGKTIFSREKNAKPTQNHEK